jgi:hypothetical protein
VGGAQVGAGARVKAREVKRRSCLTFILFSSRDRDRDCFTIFLKKCRNESFSKSYHCHFLRLFLKNLYKIKKFQKSFCIRIKN